MNGDGVMGLGICERIQNDETIGHHRMVLATLPLDLMLGSMLKNSSAVVDGCLSSPFISSCP